MQGGSGRPDALWCRLHGLAVAITREVRGVTITRYAGRIPGRRYVGRMIELWIGQYEAELRPLQLTPEQAIEVGVAIIQAASGASA